MMAAPRGLIRSQSTIQEFDGDISEGLSEDDVEDDSKNAAGGVHRGVSASSQQVVTTRQHVHVNLLLVALLDLLSTFYGNDERQQYQLFKALVNALLARNILQGFGSLDEASSLRSQYKRAFSKLLKSALDTVQKEKLPFTNIEQRANFFLQPRLNIHQPFAVPSLHSVLDHNTSRYHEDFQQIRRVGYGAYGSVFKVKNKLDSREYAIKKISFESSEPELWMKIITEVKLLAQLSHKHIVRYHNAWIEYESSTLLPYPEVTDHPDGIPGLPYSTVPAITYSPASNDSLVSPKQLDGDQDDSIVFAETSAPGLLASKDALSNASISDSLSSDSLNAEVLSSPSSDGISHVNGKMPKPVVVLHIQMELCKHTLKDWITTRNAKLLNSQIDKYSLVDPVTNLCLLKQILKAVAFIHDNKLIHRDIKPKNIFLTPSATSESEDIAKVGDFGLARHASTIEEPLTPHPGAPSNCSGAQCPFEPYTCGVGTTIYAAPEQLSGSNYTEKCDMYSIGLVIFEMYHPFCTEMERMKSLEDIRKNVLPDEFQQKWPEQARCIGELLCKDATLRPSATELLHSELFVSREKVMSSLRAENSSLAQRNLTLAHENTELRRLLAQRDLEVAMLRRQLVNITMPS